MNQMSNKTISFFYIFSICCFGILLFINHFSFSFLTDIPILLSYNKTDTSLFTVNYFYLLAGVVIIYIFLAVIGFQVLGTGMSEEGIAMIRRIATIVIMISLLSPFYNGIFVYCGLIGTILSNLFTIVFTLIQWRSFNEEV
jgi:hypothetical protein